MGPLITKKRLTAYQREVKKQRKEHPNLPQKYLRMISHDHVNRGGGR